MIVWTAFPFEVGCGACFARIPARDPVAILTVTRRERCMACAPALVDEEQFLAALAALDRAPDQPAHPTPLPPYRRPQIRAPRALTPADRQVFDSKLAATGERED